MNVKIEFQKPHGAWTHAGGISTSEGAMMQQIGRVLAEHSRRSGYPTGTRFRAVDENGRMLDML